MAANHANVIAVACPTSITAYTLILASTTFKTNRLILSNSGNTTVALAYGASGSEVDLAAVAPNTTLVLDLSLNQIPVGTRLSCIAEGAVGSSGYFTTSIMP